MMMDVRLIVSLREVRIYQPDGQYWRFGVSDDDDLIALDAFIHGEKFEDGTPVKIYEDLNVK